jgi:hypothetical protein
MGAVLGFKYFFTLHHLFESFFALLIEYYELAHARRMSHFQALGNPLVAHSAVLLWGQSSHGNILLDEVRCAGRVCAWLDHFDLFIRARCIM